MIPFPTRLLAEYGGADDAGRVATTVYGLTLLLSAAMTSALWLYARRAALIDPSASEDELAIALFFLVPMHVFRGRRPQRG